MNNQQFPVRNYTVITLCMAICAAATLLLGACHTGPSAEVLNKSIPLMIFMAGVSETIDPVQPAVIESAPEATSTIAEVDKTVPADASASNLLPAEIEMLLPNADPVIGEQLSTANACFVCHPLEEVEVPTGSSWHNIGVLAATRVEGQSAEEYIYLSIVDPNIHIVEGSLPNMMPATYKDILTPTQFADIITYLLTIKAE